MQSNSGPYLRKNFRVIEMSDLEDVSVVNKGYEDRFGTHGLYDRTGTLGRISGLPQ